MIIHLEGIERNNYTTIQWKNILKTELNALRPILYAGFSSSSGHAFVCDGFDIYDYFHMNWGWGGFYDGYFYIDALNPGSTGIEDESSSYNNFHQAVIGIKPPEDFVNYQIELFNFVNTTPYFVIDYGASFKVNTNVVNTGTTNFTGDYCAAIFDEDLGFIDYVEIISNWSLSAGYYYTYGLEFTYPGSYTLLPGFYFIEIFYRPVDGDWVQVADGNYLNYCSIYVANMNFMELYDEMKINDDTLDIIIRGEPFDVHLDVANYGTVQFKGLISLVFYDLEGYFAEIVETKEDMILSANYHYSDGLTFSSSGSNLSSGTYLMALSHKPSWDDWQLVGGTYYNNPIKVIIKEPPIQPDLYESNDSVESAYNLTYMVNDRVNKIKTKGSNLHSDSDYDFYSLNLPSVDSYEIIARVHDSYDSGDTNIYTNDVLFSYYFNEVWSDVFDDIMPENIIVQNGGNIIFYVAPYFYGETGTYALEVEITNLTKNLTPNINDIPDLTLIEDSTSLYSVQSFYDYVNDPNPGDSASTLNYNFHSSANININFEDNTLILDPIKDFYGYDSIKLIVDDGELFDIIYIKILVKPVNDPPVITSRPDTFAIVNYKYTYSFIAEDIDNDILFYSASVVPSWLGFEAFNPDSAVLMGTPSQKDTGDHRLVLEVTDNKVKMPISQKFTITVEKETGILYKIANEFKIYPNPFSYKTTIYFPNSEQYGYQLYLYDLTGKIIITIHNITGETIELIKGKLPAGIFIIELRGPEIYRGKILIE